MESSLSIKKAITVEDIYNTFKAQPLQLNELDEFFIDTQKVRGNSSMRDRLVRRFEHSSIGSIQHILFVGHKGSGKSTELNKLQKEIENDFLVLNFSVQKELDPVHLNYIELFIATLEQLFNVAKDKNINISKEYLNNITSWLQTQEIQEIKDKYIGGEVETGAGMNVSVPYLANFFSKFRLSAKNSLSLKETIKINIEPKLSNLIEHCNLLINEIRFQLTTIGKKDILIIIEDLDKIPVDRADELFFSYANQLVQIQSNVIFTFPIALHYNTRFTTIKQSFSEVFELPMIKVTKPNEDCYPEGVAMMKSIVEKRMDLSLFENETLLKQLILKSGGCIRDLFRMIVEAAEQARDYDAKRITDDHCKKAILLLKREYESTIADNYKNGKKIEVAKYFDVLVTVAKTANKKIENSEEALDLRQNLCILGYNGEGWCDVHPVVKDILIEREKWDGKQS